MRSASPARGTRTIITSLAGALLFALPVRAAEWPTFRGDAQRSGVTAETLATPLVEVWVHRPAHAPVPAWPGPAKADYWHELHELTPTLTYDRAFHVAVVGGALYFGSSADDSVHCLDAATGKERWRFTTEGPVRLAPTVVDGRVTFGSDDGLVYCLDAADGTLRWSHRGGPEDRRLPGNGRIISRWPIRSGTVDDGERVHFTAGIFPDAGVTLHAVDAATGEEIWKRDAAVTAQGYLLASPSRLFVPAGRTSPFAFDRPSGESLGSIGGVGGSFALVLEDMLVEGMSEKGVLRISEPLTKERIVSARALRMIADGPRAWFLRSGSLSALDRGRYLEVNREINTIEAVAAEERSEAQIARLADLAAERTACLRWDVACAAPYELILAGDTLFVGGNDEVLAHDVADGSIRWRAPVDGRAHGLAVADGRLYVSTDTGTIHCFATLSERPVPASDSGAPRRSGYSPLDFGKMPVAGAIVRESGVRQGYALVLDETEGHLACELARSSELRVIATVPRAEDLETARARLRASPDVEERVSLHHLSSERLPYPDRFANLIVLDELKSPRTDRGTRRGHRLVDDDIWRLLRPDGGTIALLGPNVEGLKDGEEIFLEEIREMPDVSIIEGRLVHFLRRPPLVGGGEWTHLYADPANGASSGDELVRGEMELQWYGRPGPREMIDRHHRNVPPLYKDGRCFIPGDQIVYAVDAYNGTILWDTRLPESRRLGVFLDSTNLVVDEEHLWWAAADRCHGFAVASGEETVTHELPDLGAGEERAWGYLATVGDTLFGSTCKPNAAHREHSKAGDQALWYQGMKLVTSDGLFALDRDTGATKWTWRGGAVVNTTITIADDTMWFVETTSPPALADPVGQLPLAQLFDGGEQSLVCLDATDGSERWRRLLDTSAIDEVCYLAVANGTLLFSGCRRVEPTVEYHYFTFDAATGAPGWTANHLTGLPDDGGHGEYNRHPTIIGDTVYAWPYAYELSSGNRIEGWKFDRRGHGCGGISASAGSLFWRGGNPWMLDVDGGREVGDARKLNSASRPGCWINIIPAGGLALVPEASSGCTCAFPFQMSMAFAPALPAPRIEPEGSLFVDELVVRLVDPSGTGRVHYTTVQEAPSRETPLYDPDLPIRRGEQVVRLRARTFWPDGGRSSIVERTFRRVEPLPAERDLPALTPGLQLVILEGDGVATVGDLEEGVEIERRVHPRFDLEFPRPAERFGARFAGYLRVPETGIYRFTLRSDDGSRLSIGGQVIVDHDGPHGASELMGSVALAAGHHRVEVLYFEATGDETLTVFWNVPGAEREEVPPEILFHRFETKRD